MILPEPLVVVNHWGVASFLPLAALLAAIGAGAFAYVYALRAPRSLPLLGIVLASGAGMAIAACAPVLFSSDVYAYAAYGEMARLGMNPYAHPPAGFADPVVRAAQLQWISAFPVCVYGPAFVVFARSLMTALAPFGLHAQLDAFRVAACVALMLCAVLAHCSYPGDSVCRLRSATAIGLNPVAIWSAVEGHNDVLALGVVLAGFTLVRRSPAIGAAIAALSATIKAPGAAAVIAYALVERRGRLGTAAGLALVALLSIPLLRGISGEVAPHGHYAPAVSLQAVFVPLGAPVALAVVAMIAAALSIRGVRLLRDKARHEGWIWLGIAAWAAIPNPYPWYSLWLVALAALSLHTRAAAVAIALSLTSVLRYVPDAAGALPEPASLALAVAASLPFAALIPQRAVRRYNERLV